jgi:UDP-N-acetylmuramoyl-L-alanyl-D-glutamate--2,6-diaminopimelate ligase
MMRPTFVAPRPLSGLAALLGVSDPTGGGAGSDSVGAVRGGSAPGGEVTGVTHDSRQVRPGDVYAALTGSRVHGAVFATRAAEAGAVAVLTDPVGRARAARSGLPIFVVDDPRTRLGEVAAWVYGYPTHDVMMIGVTGTSGKSTSTFLLEAGLRAAGHTTGLIGGVEIHAGDDVRPAELTTPESTDLQAMLAAMRDAGVTAAAMEVSSHALAFGRVDGMFYEASIFTNLSQDHLDFHGTMEDYFAAKASLFAPERSRVGVVNVDDSYGRRLTRFATIPLTTFSPGGDPGADWRAVDVVTGQNGSTFRVVGPGGIEADAAIALVGPYNVANALGAVVALVEAGIPLQTAVGGISGLTGVPGRLEPVTADPPAAGDVTVLVDYAHKPGAVRAVLGTLRPLTKGRLIIVLGCGGDRDRGKRPLMGDAAARDADVAIFTTDNPRSEDPLAILHAMLEGVLDVPEDQRGHVVVEPDRAQAIAMAIGRARPGDVVVIAGKGHEQGQYVGDRVRPFDDRDVARRVLNLTAWERD